MNDLAAGLDREAQFAVEPLQEKICRRAVEENNMMFKHINRIQILQ
ncbi:hypothetical protein [Cesiribacter sp. SM1]|nr:hypothetical protein [Cesiribacter sp. SM1]